MTTLNPILDAYAEGITTREEMIASLHDVGLSTRVIEILASMAESKRIRLQAESQQVKGYRCDTGDEEAGLQRLFSAVTTPERIEGWTKE